MGRFGNPSEPIGISGIGRVLKLPEPGSFQDGTVFYLQVYATESRSMEMETKDIKNCESELIKQGHSRDDAKRLCAEREGSSKEKKPSDFSRREQK